MALLDMFRRKPSVTTVKKRSWLGYAGAIVDRLFPDRGNFGSADTILSDSLATLRSRSRDFQRNNEYYAWYLNLLKSNVIGADGIRLQVKARNPDRSLDRPGSQMVEDEWADFCKTGSPTVDGRLSMRDVLNLVIVGVARDGEVLLKKVKSKNYPSGIALQFIEPDLLDETLTQDSRDGNPIRMGVEVDRETQRPVAYHILRQHPGDTLTAVPAGSKHVRVPAEDIIHVYMVERAGQTRGAPWGTSTFRSLKMLHGYREAELVAARVGASKLGFFVSPAGDGFTADGFEAGSDGRPGGGAPIINAEPGTFHQLPDGVDFKAWNPDHPSTAFADFEKAILRGVASALGVNYSALSNDFEGISYSSIRHGALSERDFYKTLQMFVIDHFLVPVYAWWLDHTMDFGRLPFTGETKYRKFLNGATWRPRGFAWVDPEKEMRAAVMALQHGVTSHSDIAASQGRDIEETFAQIRRDMDAAASYGFTMNYLPFGDPRNAPQQEDSEDDGSDGTDGSDGSD